MTKNQRALTVRLPEEQAQDLEAIARVEGRPVAEEVRDAIADRIAARRADGDFRDRIKRHIQEDADILERLAE